MKLSPMTGFWKTVNVSRTPIHVIKEKGLHRIIVRIVQHQMTKKNLQHTRKKDDPSWQQKSPEKRVLDTII
jgi:hypothetical protein